MRKLIVHTMGWLLVAAFMVTQVYADAGSPTALDAVVREVLENNPELRLYEAEIAAAQGGRKTAGLWANPEISGSIGQKRAWNEENELTGKGRAGELSVTQQFEWPGRIGLRKAIADRDIELATLGLEQFRALIAARAKIAAYELFAAREKAAATREVADHLLALREVLVQRGQAGLTPLLETRVIEAMELNLQRKAGEASLVAQAALFDLNQLRGAAPDADVSMTQMNLAFHPLEKSRDSLVTLARSNDLSVRLRTLELARQGFRVDLAKNEHFPAVSAGPSISEERAGDRERVIGVAVSLPLPLWNRNQGNIDVAQAQQGQAETSLDVAQREAERRVIESTVIYETKLKEMASWQPDTIQHFREAAELADRHYRLGAVPVSTYLELQTQYLETIGGLLDTKKEAFQAATQLELLTATALSLADVIPAEEVR